MIGMGSVVGWPSGANTTAQGKGCNHGGSCIRSIDMCYGYTGFLFDLVRDTDPQSPLTDANVAGLFTFPAGVNTATQTVRWLKAVGDTLIANAVNAVTQGATSAAGQAINGRTGSDVPVTAGAGNSGGSSVMRLREGIERFMITDINNPAASAKAQSNIFVMYDRLSTLASKFNHVPGGSNVLFMDGHVQFIKYPGDVPVNKTYAIFDGTIDPGTD